MNNDNLKRVHKTLLDAGYTPPTYEEFERDMQDENNLQNVYNTLKKEGYTPPEYKQFKSDMGFGEVKPVVQPQNDEDFSMSESELGGNTAKQSTITNQGGGEAIGEASPKTTGANEPMATQPAQQPTVQAGRVENVVKAENRDGVRLRYYEENGKRIYHPDDVAAWQQKTQGQTDVQEQLPLGVTRFQWEHVYTEEQRNEARKRMREQAKMQGAATGVTSGTNQVGDMNVAKSAGEWEGAVSRRQKTASQNAFRNSGGVQAQEAKTAQVQAQQAAVDALPSALTSLKQLEQAGVDANTSLQFNPETGKFENRASMVDVEVKDEEGNNTIVDEEGNTFKDVQDENGNVITAKEQQEAYNYAKAQENIRNARFSREIAAQEEYRRTHEAPTEEPNPEDLEKYPTDQDYYQAKAWWEEITESQQMPEQGKGESRESYLLRVQNYLDRMKRYYEERIEAAPSAASLGSPNASNPYVSALLKEVPTYTEYDVRREYAKWAEDMRDNFPELFDTKTNEAMEILYNPVLRLGRSTAELIANATEMVAGENAVSEGLHKMVDASRERESKRIITNGVADLWDKHGGIVSTAAMGWMGMPLLITTGAGDQAYQARANGASALGATVAGISNGLIWTMASKVVGTPLTNRVFNGIGKVQATRAMDYVQKVLGGADKKAAANLKAALESFASLAEKAGKTLQMAETKSVKAHLMQIAAGTFHSTLDMATASALCQFICLYDGEKLMKTDENGNVVEAKGLEKLSEAGKNALVGLKEGAIDGALFGLFFGAFGHGRQMWSDCKSLKDMTRFTPEEVSVASNGKVEGYNPETDVLIGMVGRDSNAPAVLIVGKSGKEGYVKCMLSNGQYVDIPQQNFGLIKKMGKDTFNEMLDNAVQEYYNGDLQAEPDAPASDLVKSKYKYQEALQKMNEVGDWTEEEKVALNGDYKSIGQAIMDGKIEERHVAVVESYQQALREYSERLYGAKQSVQEATEAYRNEVDALGYVEKSGKNPTYIVECEIIKGVREDEEPRRGYVLTGEYEQGDGSVMVLDAETGRKIMMKGEDIRVGNVRRMDRLIEERKAELEQAEAAKIDGDVTSYLTEGAREFPIMIDGETRYAKFVGWDAEGRAVLRLPNGDQFAETRAEVQEQYRNAVLYSARTFDMDNGKLRVTAFDNSEMPEVSGERLEVSGESQEPRVESQEPMTESQEARGESRGIDSEAYQANIPYGDYEQGESYETRVNGEPVTIDIAGVREGENGEKTYVVEVKDTDMRTIETREMREDELSSLLHPEEAREAAKNAMPMREENGKIKADWYAATPERAADYIYKERGWTEQEADEFIRMQREAAEKEADELGKNPPKMELDEDAYDSKKAEWQANMNDAQRRAEHWKNIEQARKNQLAAEARDAFKEKVDEVNAQKTADNGQQNAIGNYEREQGEIEERGGLVRNDSAENNLPAVWRETLHGLGRHIGRKIVVVSEEDAERILGDKDSEGLYDTNTNTIYISEAHIRGNENMLRYVAGHETTHALRSENPEVWNKFVDVVRNAMGKEAFDEKFNEITERYNSAIDRINQNGGLDGRMLNHLSKDAATEEVCAWWSGKNILTDIDAARRIIDEAERAGGNPKTIIQKVLDWIDGVLGALKAALDRGEKVQAQYDAVAKAKEMWQDMYNIASAKETERQTPKDTSIDDAVKFAIKVNHNSPYLLKKADGSFVDPETGERLGFDHRFMGRGEGAQSHGYGSYFSVNDLRKYGNSNGYTYKTVTDLFDVEPVKDMNVRTGDKELDRKKAIYEAAFNLWDRYDIPYNTDYSPEDIRNIIDGDIRRIKRWDEHLLSQGDLSLKQRSSIKEDEYRIGLYEYLRDHVKDFRNRHHYAVDIPDDTGTNYIDERKPISNSQVEKIKNGLLNDERYLQVLRREWRRRPKAAENVSFDEWSEDAAGVQAAYGLSDGWRLYTMLSNTMGGAKFASSLLNRLGFAGIRYDGRRDGECYVIFDENDAKITDHIRFSVADKERTLMGVHNISEDKLKKAIKQGGLANPSMAVVDTKQGIHTQFGEISLIPKSSLIDTKKGRNAGTYAGDIWSPTYPSVSKFLTKQGDKHRMEIAKEVANGDKDMERHIASTIFDYVDGNGDRLHFLFLKQKGLDPQLRGERIKHSHEEYEAAKALLGDDFINERDFTEEQEKALLDLMTRDYEEKLREDAEKITDPEKRQKAIDALTKANRERFVDENGKLYFSYVNSYLYDVWRDEDKRNNPRIDWYGTDVDASNRVAKEGLSEEYADWKDNLFDEGDVEEKLFDGYTPSGMRRYVPNTVENASKLMNKRSTTNAYNEGGLGATRSALLQRFTTLKDIREHKDMLRKDDEAKQIYENMSNELFDIIKQLSDMQKISDNPFSNIDYAEARLQEAITQRDPIGYLNREFGYSIDKNSDYASQLMNFISDVKAMPSKYFETKFKRPVGLDEFAVAVVPEDTSAEVVDALKEAGLEVHTYAKDENDQHRTAAVMNAVSKRDDIMFSFAGIRGATNADKAEGVETRMVALGTAKQMEADGKPAIDTKIATGWERGKDGKWRYEMPDLKLHLSQYYTGTTKLSEIADAPELFAAYPSMQDIDVEVFDNPLTGTMGATSVKRVKDGNQFGMAKANIDKFPTYESYLSTLEARREKYLKQINEKERPEEYEDVKDILDNAIASSKAEYDRWTNLVEHADDIDKITISLNNAATRSAKESVEKTLIHEVQHVIQEIEGFAKGGNVKSILNDEEVRNVFIKELQDRRGNAEAILEEAKQSGDEERIKVAQSIVDKWDSVAKDFMNGDVSAEKAFEMYQRIAGEVEARNAAERSEMTPEERRRSLAEDTEDYYRGEQIVTYGDAGGSASIVAKDKPTFYSNAERAVEGIKQEKATPEQWLAMIQKAGGLKAGEDKWMGLSAWLNEQAEGKTEDGRSKSITKQEVLDFIRSNRVEVEEIPYQEYIDYDDNPNLIKYRKEYQDSLEKYETEQASVNEEMDAFNDEMYNKYGEGWASDRKRMSEEDRKRSRDLDSRYNLLNDNELEQLAYSDMLEKYGDDFGEAFEIDYYGKLSPTTDMYGEGLSEAARHFLELDVRPINETRLDYTTEGLDNKREIALVVPSIESWNEDDEVHFGDAGEGRAIAWIRFGETKGVPSGVNTERFREYDRKMRVAIERRDDAIERLQRYRGKALNETQKRLEEENQYIQELEERYKDVVDVKPYRVLVIDEIQSNRHQAGRERGYKVSKEKADAEMNAFLDRMREKYNYNPQDKFADFFSKDELAELDRLNAQQHAAYFGNSDVPDAPFDKNWHELAMKRMLRYAAENGYDKIAWTKGEQQAERYNIGNVVDALDIRPYKAQSPIESDGHDLSVHLKEGATYEMFVQPDGTLNSDSEMFNGKNVSEVFGKELGKKIMEANERTWLDNEALRIGAEGMAGFYDNILPRFMDKYGKKWGVKTEEIELPNVEEAGRTMWSVDVTPEMKESVMQGQPMFSVGGRVEPRDVKEVAAEVMSEGKMLWENAERDGATLKGVAAETGYGEGEKKRLFGLFRSAEKGGKSVDEIAHQVMELCNDLNIPCDGTDEAKAAVLDVLSESEKMSDIRNYARNRRMAEADEQTRHEMEQEQAHRDQHYMDEYGMTEEEYQDYLNRTTAEMMSGSEADRDEIANLRTEKEKLEARLAKQKEQSDMGSPLVAFLNDQISGFKAEIERIKEENSTKLGDKQATIDDLRRRVQQLKEVRERRDELKEKLRNVQRETSEELEKKQRIVERLEALEAELNNKNSLLSKKVLDAEMKNLEFANVKEELVSFIEKQYNASWMPYLGKDGLNSLLNSVKNAKTISDLEEAQTKVRDIAANGAVRFMQDKISKLLKLPKQGKNTRGMVIGRGVDERTRKIFDNLFKSTQDLSITGMEEDMDDLRKQQRTLRDELKYLEQQREEADEVDALAIDAEIESKKAEQEALKEQMREKKAQIEEMRHAKEANAAGDVEAEIEAAYDKLAEATEGRDKWTDRDTDHLIELEVKKLYSEAMKAGKEAYDLQNEIAETERIIKENNKQAIVDGTLRTEAYRESRNELIGQNKERMQMMASAKMAQAEKLTEVEKRLSELYSGGHQSLRYQVQREIERKRELLSKSFGDIRGKHYDSKIDKVDEKSDVLSWVLSPLNTFEYMCKNIVRNGRGEDSFIYNYFIKSDNGAVAAYNNKLAGIREQRQTLNDKVREIFGLKNSAIGIDNEFIGVGAWARLAERSDKIDDESGVYIEKDGQQYELPMSKGQAMYVYMVWKMQDGRVKLQNQGFSERSIEQIRDFLGNDYLQLADWIQEDYLTATREKYNERYIEMYHTSMDKIDNYVPLKISKAEVSEKKKGNAQNVNLDRKEGSLIQRTHNVSAVDIHRSAFDVITKHIEDMEDWYAYVRVRRDLDTLMNSRHFRNQLNKNDAGCFKYFKDAAMVGTESENIDPPSDVDNVLSNVTKNIVGTNIAWRVNTALKQFLSAPAYLAYSNNPKFLGYLTKNAGVSAVGGNLKWCYDNLESFRNRVKVGNLGDYRLSEDLRSDDAKAFAKYTERISQGLQSFNKFGMLPNRLVDAITCSMGIKSIYEYEMSKANNYVKKARLQGAEKEAYLQEARKKALREADMFYNATQQSSVPAYLSKAQKGRSLLERGFTAYQNSNLAYTRMMMTGLKDLRNDVKFQKAIKDYTEQFKADGMSEEKAKKEARILAVKNFYEDLQHIAVPILLKYWWALGSSGLLGFFTSDDDDKEEQGTLQKAGETIQKVAMPLQGLPAANILNDIGTSLEKGWDYEGNYIFSLNELSSLVTDIVEAERRYGLESPEMAGKVIYRLSRFAGIDIQTIANICIGVEGLVNDGHEYEDWMVDAMYILNTPKSGRREAARTLAKESKSLEEYAERILLADGYLKRHPELSKWMPWQRGLDKYGKIPDKEVKQIVSEYRKLNPETQRSDEPAADTKPQDEVKERMEELKSDKDKMLEEVMRQYIEEAKPYYDEWKNIEDGDEAESYRTKHPEVRQYEDLKTIKDAISRWRKDAREGEVTPEEAAESIKNELGKIKM